MVLDLKRNMTNKNNYKNKSNNNSKLLEEISEEEGDL